MSEENKAVSDVYFADPNEMILPDDFDPNNPDYDLDAGMPTDTPAEPAPTTEPEPTETDAAIQEVQPASPEPTTAPDATDATAQTDTLLPPIPQTIKVRFNHEDRELTLDEAATFAQKGMNYDRMQQRLNDLEARSTKNEELARKLGYKDAAEMFDAAEKNFVEKQVEDLVEQGNTEAVARLIVKMQMAEKAAAAAPTVQPEPEPAPAQTPTAAPAAEGTMTPERKAELLEFVREYPEAARQPLPPEVIKANRSGVRLLVAYERFKNQAALQELAILKQNQAAAAKAPVSGVTGKPGVKPAQQDDDPFLKGFDSDPWLR